MDHYQFPHITHISQCLQAIEGSPEFIVAERDRHTIINYIMMGNGTFPPVSRNTPHHSSDQDMDAAIRRECRGIVFGPDGRVIARRLHKFFNAGERPEVELPRIDLNLEHVTLEKLDGSMITPIPIGDHVRWGTKMGLTSVGFQAEEFVSTRPEYLAFANHCIHWGITPIFEWCSRKQRIVIDYPKDGLVLLAVRNNVTGEYLSHKHMKALGIFWKVPVVEPKGLPLVPMEELVEIVRASPYAIEGYVIRFEDGHSVKMKTDDYVRIHRAKDSIMQEKRVIEMIINEKVDDVLPHLPPHEKRALEGFNDSFWWHLLQTRDQIEWLYAHWYSKVEGDKKNFAIKSPDLNSMYKSVIFSIWDVQPGASAKQRILEELTKRVQKNLGSGTKVDANRWIWGSVKWSDYIGAEDQDA